MSVVPMQATTSEIKRPTASVGKICRFTKDGVRIEPSAILVEHDRILIASDSLGIFDFALPERQSPASHNSD